MKKFIILIGSCLILCSCQSTVDTVENRDKNMQPNKVDTSRVSTDGFLKDRLQIIRVDKVQRPDGLLNVQVTIRNARTGMWSQIGSWFMGDNPYRITYRFTWLDKDGMEVKTAANTWLPKQVIPGDTVRLAAISPNAKCKDFILSIREDQRERD